ncbi:DHH family phosphoesterase, partial [[Eubacterium] siraeum]|nr:DHH family phosphoesterase [[Eubacterium] siraeum]
MVDGYEELISGCLECEKAHVSVQIDKLLEDFAGQTTGVLRKNASDRFIAVIEERHLQEILRNKVEIIDKAREIFVNDRLNLTMSIGIGRTGKTLKESEQF